MDAYLGEMKASSFIEDPEERPAIEAFHMKVKIMQ